MVKCILFRSISAWLGLAIFSIFSGADQAFSSVAFAYTDRNILIAEKPKEKHRSPCSPSATEKEFLGEVSRLNSVIDKIDNGEIAEDYLPIAAYNNVRCLFLRGDDERLKDISLAAIEEIDKAPQKIFSDYAPFLYFMVSQSELRANSETSAKKILNRGWVQSLKRDDYASAIEIGSNLLFRLSILKSSKDLLSHADKLIQLSSYDSPGVVNAWRRHGYYVYLTASHASSDLGDHVGRIAYAEKGLKALDSKSFDVSSLVNSTAYLHILIASGYGQLDKPDLGLDEITRLETKMGEKCSEGNTKLTSDNNLWCSQTKAFLYTLRSIDAEGIDSRLSIADARRALKLDPADNDYLEYLADTLFLSQKRENTVEALALYTKLLNLLSRDQKTKNSERFFWVKNSIAACLNELDRYTEALEVINQSLARSRTLFGDNSEIIVDSKGLLASINYNLGRVDENVSRAVEQQLRQARAEKLVNKEPSQFLSNRLLMLSAIRLDQNKYVEAASLAKESVAEKVSVLREKIHLLPTDNREEFTAYTFGDIDAIYSFSNLTPAGAELALFARLNFHGLTEEIAKLQQSLLLVKPELAEQSAKLRNIDSKLSAIQIPGRVRDKLIAQKKVLEKAIYSNLKIESIPPLTVHQVAKVLPDNAALVEIKKFRRWYRNKPRSKRWGDFEYQALVLTPDSKVISVPLGPSNLIDAQLDNALKQSTFTPSGSLQKEEKVYAAWNNLFSSVISPLIQHIPSVKQIYLSPDGELHKVPWSLASTSLSIDLITTGRELVFSKQKQFVASPSRSVVIADPSFDKKLIASNVKTSSGLRGQLRSDDLASSFWSQLPFTRKEGEDVSDILNAELVTGVDATASKVKSISRPEYLHVATHGFFLENNQSSQNPMLLSGLVFSGANSSQIGVAEDSYLTALESASLDLFGTKLVVLSACSTAQGVSKNGEGVYGLRRSLKVAGSNASILSLWKVDDAATAYLMKLFYKGLEKGLPIKIALAEAQQGMKDGPVPAWRHPYYWLAWQLVGAL